MKQLIFTVNGDENDYTTERDLYEALKGGAAFSALSEISETLRRAINKGYAPWPSHDVLSEEQIDTLEKFQSVFLEIIEDFKLL